MPDMAERHDPWFKLGYALERVRARPHDTVAGSRAGRALVEVMKGAGLPLVAGVLADRLPSRRGPGFSRLLRAAGAGAGAALAREVLDALLHGELPTLGLDDARIGRLLSGVARGLVYGGVVDTRLPGPPLARGAVFGLAEYLLAPLGGATAVLGRRAPHRRIPGLAAILEGNEPGERDLIDHLVFGLVLALLLGDGRRDDDADGDSDDD